jgi:hypothetical protein
MLVLGRRHLERVLRTYTAHYNKARPHRGLDLKTPEPQLDWLPRPALGRRVRRHDLLGGASDLGTDMRPAFRLADAFSELALVI